MLEPFVIKNSLNLHLNDIDALRNEEKVSSTPSNNAETEDCSNLKQV